MKTSAALPSISGLAVRSFLAAAVWLIFLAVSFDAHAGLAPEKIERLRNSIALVTNKNQLGIAFCLSDSGLFAVSANQIYATKPDQEVEMIFETKPGEQKSFKARVQGRPSDGILFLRMGDGPAVTPLAVADETALVEKQPATFVGFARRTFPQGTMPTLFSMPVELQRFRKVKNNVHWVDFLPVIERESVGGGLFTDTGELVSLVPAQGTGSESASRITRLREIPLVSVADVSVPFEKRFEPVEFLIELVSVSPLRVEPAVQLEVRHGNSIRKIPAEKVDAQKYRALIAPQIPAAAGAEPKCKVAIEFGLGQVEGLVDDLTLTVGGRPRALSTIASIVRLPLGEGYAVDNQPAGTLPELAKLVVDVQGVPTPVDARFLRKLQVQNPKLRDDPISYHAIATLPAGKPIVSESKIVQIAGLGKDGQPEELLPADPENPPAK